MYKFKNSGFTMVELMMVVIIIGILVTIAIPNYMHSVETAKCSQGIGILKNMRTAELDYFRENDTFTNDITVLEAQVGGSFVDTSDWAFSVVSAATTFTLTATRQSGPFSGKSVDLNETGVWTDNGYPHSTPWAF
jgi:prepilin-type N-terminal cleavage/methylation domain-containing protein